MAIVSVGGFGFPKAADVMFRVMQILVAMVFLSLNTHTLFPQDTPPRAVDPRDPQGLQRKESRALLSAEDLTPQERETLDATISQWVSRLGDDSYAVRQQAATELQRIGLVAFEQLREAMLNPDPQIASTAQYLIQSIHQTWAWDTDPLEVKSLLESYGACSPTDRSSRIDRLSTLSSDASLAALCRLVRYETNEAISKHAALTLMKRTVPSDLEGRKMRAKIVRQVIGHSQRVSCQWLARYCDDLVSPRLDLDFDAPWWTLAVRAEHERFVKTPRLSSSTNVLNFYQWVCSKLAAAKQKDQAIDLANGMLELLPTVGYRLTGICHWAIEAGIPEWVERLEQRFPETFRAFARLDYALAESYTLRNMPDEAQRIADRAFYRGADPAQIQSRFSERCDVASVLRNRGMLNWAEREYSVALKNADPLNPATMTAQIDFSAMLQDSQKYSAAANLWRDLTDRLENEPLFAQQIDDTYPEIEGKASSSFIERYYYLSAMDAKQRTDPQTAIKLFRKGLEISQRNSDTWIELYQISEDKDSIRKESQWLKNELRESIHKLDQELLEGSTESITFTKSRLATALNELAWLLGNTDDDLVEATQFAERACQIDGINASYLDTLACVHFHKGSLSEAIETQKRAVALEPHNQQLKRVLNKYEKALHP